MVLDDVRMVKGVENSDLLHDAIDVVHQLVLVQHFNGHLKVRVVFVVRLKDATKRSCTEHLCLGVNLIVLSQLCNTLLLSGHADLDYLPLHRLDRLVVVGAL